MKMKYTIAALAATTLAANATLTATSYAQNHYDWTIKDDEASWGNNWAGGGSYSRDHVAWSGSHIGDSISKAPQEGPYNGRSGLCSAQKSTGIMTRTDPNAIFDLSAVGSSATIRTAYHYQAKYPDTGGHAHMYQFGLTNNAGYFGKAGNESLIVAADYQGQDFTTGTATYDLDLLDHNGLDTTDDGHWRPNPLTQIASDLELSSWSDPGTWDSRPGKSHAIELTYINLGNNKFQLDVSVMDLNISGRTTADTLTSTNQIVKNSFILDNPFSDLSALRPGFGVAVNDSNIPISEAAFDWEDAYAVPELPRWPFFGYHITAGSRDRQSSSFPSPRIQGFQTFRVAKSPQIGMMCPPGCPVTTTVTTNSPAKQNQQRSILSQDDPKDQAEVEAAEADAADTTMAPVRKKTTGVKTNP